MRSQPVDKPTVVRNHQYATGKVFQRFFQCAQRIDINIVGRLIEQQHVATFAQGHRKLNTVAFTAGEHPDFLLLVSARKVELTDICSDVDL